MKRQAFTLIELLVVIAVIAVLMAILMPALNLAREQGRKMKCAGNMRSLALANSVYASSNDGWAVPCRFKVGSSTVLWTTSRSFREAIGYAYTDPNLSMVQTPEKYKCPSDRQEAWAHAYDIESGNTRGTLVSYGYNIEDWFPSVGTANWNATMAMDTIGYKLVDIQHPAEKLQFNESHDWWSKWRGANYIKGWDVLGQTGTVRDYKNVGCGGPTMYRHNEAANFAFYDGHVESIHKTKAYIPEHAEVKPYQPGMWVVRRKIWEQNGGGS